MFVTMLTAFSLVACIVFAVALIVAAAGVERDAHRRQESKPPR
jgi:hypothetical protein